MKQEIEAKFLLQHITLDSFRDNLRSVGATLKHPERLMKRSLFGQEANSTITRADYIRVRDEGNGVVTMSAKKHTSKDGDPRDNLELVVEVSEYEQTVALLKEAGLTVTNQQESKRETWLLHDSFIEIDTWPGLDPNVEIESPSLEVLEQTAHTLGFDWESRYTSSVEDIYMEVYKVKRDTVRKELANCTFEHPPFSSHNK